VRQRDAAFPLLNDHGMNAIEKRRRAAALQGALRNITISILPDFSTEWGLCLALNAPNRQENPMT
jgi:hypothetical protein